MIVDETARHVRFEGLNQPGWTFNYWDGAFAPIVSGPRRPDDPPWVAQFVKFTPARVEVGFRNQTGELEHLAWFDRAALRGGACRWRSLWAFGRG